MRNIIFSRIVIIREYSRLEKEVNRMIQVIDHPVEQGVTPSYEQLVQAVEQLERENQQLRQWQQKTRDIMRNPDASPTFKALSWAQLDLFPDAVLLGNKIQIDVKRVYKHVSVSAMSATNYFKATKEVGGATYAYEHGQNEESGKRFTESDITYSPTFGTTPLNASSTVQKARQEEKNRRDEKTKLLEAIKCPSCGHTDTVNMALVPYCTTCNKEIPDAIQTAKLEDLRIVDAEVSDEQPYREDKQEREQVSSFVPSAEEIEPARETPIAEPVKAQKNGHVSTWQSFLQAIQSPKLRDRASYYVIGYPGKPTHRLKTDAYLACVREALDSHDEQIHQWVTEEIVTRMRESR